MSADSTDIWMPLYIGDYLAATQHLSAEQSGAYLHLLMHEWRNGPLPRDPDALRRIARVEKDAWASAWALLEHFFSTTQAGLVQDRLEREKGTWAAKRAASTARARAGGHAKKAKQDERASVVLEQCSGSEQATLEHCPSPSPSPSPVKTKAKTSLVKREADPRHAEFQAMTGNYWASKNPTLPMPWDGAEGKQLSALLKANPALTLEEYRKLLGARARSEVNQSQRPRMWLSKITDYASGPLDKFNKPIGGSNGCESRVGQLLYASNGAMTPSTKRPDASVIAQVNLLMKQTKANFPAQEIDSDTATMWMSEWVEMVGEHGLEKFVQAVRGLFRGKFFPTPHDIDTALRGAKKEHGRSMGRRTVSFSPLPGCTTGCVANNGALDERDENGIRIGAYPCECLRPYWEAGGTELMWLERWFHTRAV